MRICWSRQCSRSSRRQRSSWRDAAAPRRQPQHPLLPAAQLDSKPATVPDAERAQSHTFNTTGGIDPSGIFFQALGTNQRTCASCHQLSQGMGLSATAAQALFTSSNGSDPLFAAVDGANCPTVAAGDSVGHGLVLNNGLIPHRRAAPRERAVHRSRRPKIRMDARPRQFLRPGRQRIRSTAGRCLQPASRC